MKEIDIATEAAEAGARVLMSHWRDLGAEDADHKTPHDWVSKADREAEEAIKRVISGHSPSDGFLCEESGVENEGSERVWVIDPLDGTSNYLRHFPFWSISIALRVRDEVVAGLVYRPLGEECFTAELGAGAWRNGERIHVTERPSIDGSFLATGFPFRAQQHLDVYVRIFRDVASRSRGLRRAGSAALDLAYTAAGVFDGFFELALAPWDVAAGSLLVSEAGGIVSDFHGSADYWRTGNIVGAPAAVHRDLVAIIAEYARPEDLAI